VGVQELFDVMEKDVKLIKKNALQLSWYMRGGASYQDVLNMSSDERLAINEIVEKHLEVTKQSQLPFF